MEIHNYTWLIRWYSNFCTNIQQVPAGVICLHRLLMITSTESIMLHIIWVTFKTYSLDQIWLATCFKAAEAMMTSSERVDIARQKLALFHAYIWITWSSFTSNWIFSWVEVRYSVNQGDWISETITTGSKSSDVNFCQFFCNLLDWLI